MSDAEDRIARLRSEAESGHWMSKEMLAIALRAEALSRLDMNMLDEADYWYWKDKQRPETVLTSNGTWSHILLIFREQIEGELRRRKE